MKLSYDYINFKAKSAFIELKMEIENTPFALTES